MLLWNKGKFMEAEFIPHCLESTCKFSTLHIMSLYAYTLEHINSHMVVQMQKSVNFFAQKKKWKKIFITWLHKFIVPSLLAHMHKHNSPHLFIMMMMTMRCNAVREKNWAFYIVHMHTLDNMWVEKESLKVTRHHHPMNKKKPREWGTFFMVRTYSSSF